MNQLRKSKGSDLTAQLEITAKTIFAYLRSKKAKH
jgi:hypothetical protein